MKHSPVITATFFLAWTLAPAGIAHAANQIYACVNDSSGEVKLVGQNATCKNHETLVVWNVVGPQGPIGAQGPQGPAGPAGPAGSGAAGIRSGAEAFCTADPAGNPPSTAIEFERYAEFGSDISANGQIVTSFVLQPGVYQVHLSADGMVWGGAPTLPVAPGNSGSVHLFMNGQALSSAAPLSIPQGAGGPGIWLTNQASDGIRTQITTIFANWTLGGDHLVSVSNPNTTIQFITDSQMNFPNSCRLVITRLSDGPARFPGP